MTSFVKSEKKRPAPSAYADEMARRHGLVLPPSAAARQVLHLHLSEAQAHDVLTADELAELLTD